MAVQEDTHFDIGGPDLGRERVSFRVLAIAIVLAPLAWSLQLLLIYGFASPACHIPVRPGLPPGPDWIEWAVPAVNVAAILVALVAIALSVVNLRRTRPDGHTGGVMGAAAGPSRFLAIWGLWTGILFLLAITFNTVAVFWVGLCDL